MSYPMPGPLPGEPAGQPARVRPTTVTAATWLLLVVAALFVIDFILAIATSGTITDVYRDAYRGTELEGTEGFATIGQIVGAGFNLLLAIGFVVLAIFDYRGKNPARIVTWVVGGVSLCCTGLSLAMTGLMGSMQVDVEGAPDAAELQRLINEALPGWYWPVAWTSTGIAAVSLIAALILLALPPSNEFFRKQPPSFEPPPPYPQAGS